MIERVEPEAVHAPLQPETHGVEQRVLHLGIMDIKLRLAA
jgi:hypothetical protein